MKLDKFKQTTHWNAQIGSFQLLKPLCRCLLATGNPNGPAHLPH
jgi:hypothetical protein